MVAVNPTKVTYCTSTVAPSGVATDVQSRLLSCILYPGTKTCETNTLLWVIITTMFCDDPRTTREIQERPCEMGMSLIIRDWSMRKTSSRTNQTTHELYASPPPRIYFAVITSSTKTVSLPPFCILQLGKFSHRRLLNCTMGVATWRWLPHGVGDRIVDAVKNSYYLGVYAFGGMFTSLINVDMFW